MKKQFIVGMVIVTSFVSFNAFAAPAGVKGPKEMVADYMNKAEEYKKSIKDGKVAPAALETTEALKQQDKTMDDLGLSRTEKNSIKSYISKGKSQKVDVVTALNVLLAAKNGVGNKTDAESKAIGEYVDASLRFLGNADLIGDKKTSSNLSAQEFQAANAALKNLIVVAGKPTTYESSERLGYTLTMKKLNETAMKYDTMEEALVHALMETATDAQGNIKPITKEEALKRIDKLKNCV